MQCGEEYGRNTVEKIDILRKKNGGEEIKDSEETCEDGNQGNISRRKINIPKMKYAKW